MRTDEFLSRISNPAFVLSQVTGAARDIWGRVSPSEFAAMFRQVRPLTMCSTARLHGLYRAIRYVGESDVPGDIVECGSARGGSAALMGLSLKHLGMNRPLWLFDTFEGLPAPSAHDPDFKFAKAYMGKCNGSLEEVRAAFVRLGIESNTHFVKGLFENTLTSAPIRQIALLHVDGDWYSSVLACLQAFYDKVAVGGIVQFDDYGYWQGARKAVDEFLSSRGISGEMKRLDFEGRQLIKLC